MMNTHSEPEPCAAGQKPWPRPSKWAPLPEHTANDNQGGIRKLNHEGTSHTFASMSPEQLLQWACLRLASSGETSRRPDPPQQ